MTKEDTSIEIDWERNFPAKGTGQLVIKDWRFSQQIPPSTIEFRSSHENTWVMRITPDRRIEVNEDVDVTYAAQKVLDAMQQLLTPQRPAAEGEDIKKPLTDEALIECERLADIRHRKHMGSIRGQQLSPADQFLWHYARAIEAAHGIKGEA